MAERTPTGFRRFRARAEALVQSPERVQALLSAGARRLAASGGRLADARAELQLLIDFLRAWYAGDYRSVSRATLVTVAAGILYFVVPLDVIPDFIVGLGLLDDIAVIGYVVRAVRQELEGFREWRDAQARDGRSVQVVPEQPRAAGRGP